MQRQVVNFRADPGLVAALAEQARKTGVSVSAVIRDAVRKKVEPDLNPYAHLRGAASGDLEAIRALVTGGEAMVTKDRDIVVAIEALVFARMAAVRGDKGDTAILLALLAAAEPLAGDEPEWAEWRDQLRGEAIAIVSRQADEGDEDAELALLRLSENSSARASVFAKGIRTQMAAI